MHCGNELIPITLLWALRSPCNLNCRYCYFGMQEEALRRMQAGRVGELTHHPGNDVEIEVMLRFVRGWPLEKVKRVFIAGGEPLRWAGTLKLIEQLKQHCQVVVCSNGLPLVDSNLCQALLDADVDAVSVSLDSFDADYNDHYRHDPAGVGLAGVVKGVETLVSLKRQKASRMRVGIYTVVTAQNLGHVQKTADFVRALGVDYYIFQPISLQPEHPLFSALTLRREHLPLLERVIVELQSKQIEMILPNRRYLSLFCHSIYPGQRLVKSCFGGRNLFFIQPDGSVWDCPSYLKIAAQASDSTLSIARDSAASIFSSDRRTRNSDCNLFSSDCVNMWQLMAFDEICDAENKGKN